MYHRVNLSVLLVIFAFLTILGTCEITAGKIIYVDEIAAGANDGSSWDDAYNFLQDALADANEAEKPVEIRLAQGSYSPDQDTPNPEGTADRQATFQLINGVALKGGYAGLGATDPNTRDVVLFETALVGEIRSTGFGGGNSYHVVTGSGTDETAVLDGLIIAGGNANGPRLGEEPDYDYRFRYGGGIYNDAGSPTLIDCVFSDNSAYICGGGMYNSNGSNPNLTNCIFDWNSAVDGCGIYNSNSNPTLTGCVFSTNIAQNNGGGIYNEQCSPILTDCTFIDNSGHNGGGIYNSRSNPTLIDCMFIANTTLTIRSTDNTLSGGGGIYNDRSSPILSNCIFTENNAYASLSNFGGAMYNNDNSNPALTDCLFSANWAKNYGGGIYNCESSPALTDCVFNGNWAEEYGGGMYNNQSNPTLISCWFVWNWAAVITSYHDSYPSGAGMYNETSSPILSACVLSGNYAEGDGAGMYNSESSPELANCIIAGNWTADFGGAMYNRSGNPTLANCTFFGNIAYEGNALVCDSPQQKSPGNVEMTNCILWDGGSEIWNNDDSVITITYSNILGGFAGRGNIDADPLFAQAGYWVDFYDPNIIVEPDDPNASWTDGDYHLKSQAGRWDPAGESWVRDDVTSPCIDAGNPNSPLAFEPFPNGGIINMGAYGGTVEASKSPSGLHAKYGGGTGEPNNPYLIYTAEHMNTIGLHEQDWDKHFKLMANIDLSAYTGTDFNIIGYIINAVGRGRDSKVERKPFAGVFDGNGHTISNFSYHATDAGWIGLFKLVSGEDALIKNLGLINPENSGQYGVGSLAGEISSGTVSGCYTEGGSVSGDVDVGGLVGKNGGVITNCTTSGSVSGNYVIGGLVGDNGGTITNCHSSAVVLGKDNIGGLVGSDWNGTITNCSSSGSISGTGGYIGGLLGHNNYGAVTACYSSAGVSGTLHVGGLVGDNEGTISNCYSAGSVTGTYDIGGLVGFNWGSLGSTITDCYSTGSVLGMIDTGGLVGSNNGNKETVKDCFWDIQTSEQSTSAGGTGRTTSEMQIESTFTPAGWDFVGESKNGTEDIWTFYEGTNYPRLAWEDEPIEPIAPSPYGGGTGTAANPYLIYTAEQLNMIGLLQHDWGRHFKLMADIDLSGFTGTDFNIIGYAQSFEDRNAFTGVFDGNGKTISNFSHTSTDRDYVALFAYIAGGNALIKNLGLIDPNINAGSVWSWRVASLVAINSGTISNCYVKGGTVSGNEDVGGLVGDNYNGTITNCYSATSVTGNKDVSGLVGENSSGTITNCYSTASVSGRYSFGGLVGYNWGTITNSFWDIQTSGQLTSDGGTGKTTAEMQMASTFLEVGWDFVDETANGTEDIWWILEGQDYARLTWELTESDSHISTDNLLENNRP